MRSNWVREAPYRSASLIRIKEEIAERAGIAETEVADRGGAATYLLSSIRRGRQGMGADTRSLFFVLQPHRFRRYTPPETIAGPRIGRSLASINRCRNAIFLRRVISTRGRQTRDVSRLRIKKCQNKFERL